MCLLVTFLRKQPYLSSQYQRSYLKFYGLSSIVKQRNMSAALRFDIEVSHNTCSQRLGVLSVPGRQSIQTPHYFAVSSRGCVPHLSQDMMKENTSIKGVYAALEDCE